MKVKEITATHSNLNNFQNLDETRFQEYLSAARLYQRSSSFTSTQDNLYVPHLCFLPNYYQVGTSIASLLSFGPCLANQSHPVSFSTPLHFKNSTVHPSLTLYPFSINIRIHNASLTTIGLLLTLRHSRLNGKSLSSRHLHPREPISLTTTFGAFTAPIYLTAPKGLKAPSTLQRQHSHNSITTTVPSLMTFPEVATSQPSTKDQRAGSGEPNMDGSLAFSIRGKSPSNICDLLINKNFEIIIISPLSTTRGLPKRVPRPTPKLQRQPKVDISRLPEGFKKTRIDTFDDPGKLLSFSWSLFFLECVLESSVAKKESVWLTETGNGLASSRNDQLPSIFDGNGENLKHYLEII
ncbi:hypothetical protein BT63DRAFT_479041 [Microthyrium microscopicum]|uniref:Uncharacterized protein n=1 Tax=Microthyrium microscopicum TaxID=703497 RepID=A0A6A6UA75_9PEZI|nr:hypothetical protein BT63DRAFT_479041 [Microthyrium microscopicum]